MNRRGFLSSALGAIAAAAAYDPERELWVPGKKKIFIPPAPEPRGILMNVMRVWCSSVNGYGIRTRIEMTLDPSIHLLPQDHFLLTLSPDHSQEMFRVDRVANQPIFVAATQNSR